MQTYFWQEKISEKEREDSSSKEEVLWAEKRKNKEAAERVLSSKCGKV